MCFPGGGTHIPSDICFPGGGTHITRNMCLPVWGTLITRNMCFLGGGTHITRGMCFPGWGTLITRGMWFPGWGTHIIYKVLSLYYLRLLPLLAAVFILEFLCKSLLFSLRVYVCIHSRENWQCFSCRFSRYFPPCFDHVLKCIPSRV